MALLHAVREARAEACRQSWKALVLPEVRHCPGDHHRTQICEGWCAHSQPEKGARRKREGLLVGIFFPGSG